MTAKQEFYQLARSKDVTLEDVREFCRKHHSVQWRKRGRTDVEILFSNREGWCDVKYFAEQYHNRVAKQLNDLLLSSSHILSPQDTWNLLSSERQEAIRCVIEAELRNQIIAELKYDTLTAELEEVRNKYAEAKERNRVMSETIDKYRNWKKDAIQAVSNWRDNIVIQTKPLVISKNKILEIAEAMTLE